VADARDFTDQAVSLEDAGDAEAMVFPELGVALVGGDALEQHGMSVLDKVSADSPIEIIEPEYFAFSESSGFKSSDFKTLVLKLGIPPWLLAGSEHHRA